MAIIYRSDIKNVDAYSTKVLTNEVQETQTVIDSINSFVGDSPSKLEGKAWNKERSRFQVYIKALEKRKEVSTLLAEAIKSANRIMENYIAAFPWTALNKIPNVNIPKDANLDVVDSGWIAEFQKALNDAKTAYANAEANKNSISTKNKEGSALTKAKNARAGYQADMDSASAIIAACNEVIAYLEQMSTRDAEAYAKYEQVEAAIAELNVLLEDVDGLFVAPVAPAPKIVYVPVGGGGGAAAVVNNSTINGETEQTTTPTTTEQSTEQPTVQPTPITNTVTTSPVAPAHNATEVVDNTSDNTDDELLDDDYIEDEPIEEGPVIGNEDIPTQNDTIIDNTPGVVRQKNNTLRNVGLGLAGAAIAGAAGYGAYKAVKKSQENNEIEDEEENDVYNDYSNDFEIKTNEDDDA